MLTINNLTKTFYPGTAEEQRIFRDFSLSVADNTRVAVLGPNGCGKSTLFNLISGALKADGGQIALGARDITGLSEPQRAQYIGMVNQNPSLGVAPELTVLENMALAQKKGRPFTFKRLLQSTQRDTIVAQLETLGLGLEEKLNTAVKLLSGGQRQCLSLLMATVETPELLLLDEHTAALDPKTATLIMEKTDELVQQNGITTLMITHNLRHALAYADRIVMLNHGRIVLDIAPAEVTETELRQRYEALVTA